MKTESFQPVEKKVLDDVFKPDGQEKLLKTKVTGAKENTGTALTPEEKREKMEVVAEVTKELGSLFELLPREKGVTVEEVNDLLRLIELDHLSFYMKKVLANDIVRDALNTFSKSEFIAKGLEILELWIHTQSLGRSVTKGLETLNTELRRTP